MEKFKIFWNNSFKNKIIVIIVGMFIIGMIGSLSESEEVSDVKTNTNKVVVDVVELSGKTDAEIDLWCQEMNVNCIKISKYSNEISEGNIISQSVASGKKIYEGEKIEIIYSLGTKPSIEYINALKKAEIYSDEMHMSKIAIYDQLTSEYGEKFPDAAAQYAIDNISADWNANALAKAKVYQTTMSMSKSSIYDQLVSEYGEKFTSDQAQYAIDHLDN